MMTLLTTTVALIFCIQYVACVALFQANERRTAVELFEKSVRLRTALKMSAWCLLIISTFLCASLQGWERGVPLWLCMIAVAGFISLYVSAYKPMHHVKSGIAALAASALLGASIFWAGDTFLIFKETALHATVDSTTI